MAEVTAATSQQLLRTYSVIIMDLLQSEIKAETENIQPLDTYIKNAIDTVAFEYRGITDNIVNANDSIIEIILEKRAKPDYLESLDLSVRADNKDILSIYTESIHKFLSYNARQNPNIKQLIENAINAVSTDELSEKATIINKDCLLGGENSIRTLILDHITDAYKTASASSGSRRSKNSKKRSTLRRHSSKRKIRNMNRSRK